MIVADELPFSISIAALLNVYDVTRSYLRKKSVMSHHFPASAEGLPGESKECDQK